MQRLASIVRGPVILPGDIPYESGRRVWNLAVDRRPAAIVQCAEVDDVMKTIAFARAEALPLAVRSGGHSQAGHGTCEGGIVLDLSALRAIAVDPERRIARVAAGARVTDVQDAVQAHGLMTPMGGCKDVGIGGLTLGGGENFLMAKYGIVCDNVVRAELVTADGRILVASDAENPDLFWALRGGGGNFGVVTSFDYRLYEARDVLFGQFLFPVPDAAKTMRIYRDLIANAPDELDTSCGPASQTDSPRFAVTMCFCGDRARGDEYLARFRAALHPEKDSMEWQPYCASLVEPPAPSTGTGLFLSALHDEVIDIFAEALVDAPRLATGTFSHFHGAVTRVPQDATAFPLRRPGFDFYTSVSWQTEAERHEADRWMKPLGAALRPFGTGVYVNNLNADEAGRVPEAYGPNYERLASIKRKYDPDNFFRINHNIR